jgi:UDP-N-acetylmuramoyl-tripeptide--D-alanyl-D-alanine ligase
MITNIGYAHIGEFGSLEAIARVKAEIFQGIMPHGYALLNRDDPYFGMLKKMSAAEVMEFGLSDLKILEDKSLDGYRLEYRGKEFVFPFPGRHNLSNLAGALRAAEFFQVDIDDRVDAAATADPVAGRSEVIRKEITIINDCYNANPSSMLAGLEVLSKSPGRRVAVLSDMLELGKLAGELHGMVGEKLAEGRWADRVLAYGEQSERLAEAVRSKSDIPVFWYKTRDELIDRLTGPDGVKKGDTVLVKASNGMKLDEAVKTLKSVF